MISKFSFVGLKTNNYDNRGGTIPQRTILFPHCYFNIGSCAHSICLKNLTTFKSLKILLSLKSRLFPKFLNLFITISFGIISSIGFQYKLSA